MSALQKIKKEIEILKKDPPNNWTLAPIDETNLFILEATLLGPQNTPYEGGKFVLNIHFPSDYPFKPPECKFSTKIYHPNITTNGVICKCCPLRELGKLWEPQFKMTFILEKIKELFVNPYLEYSCGNTEALLLYLKDKNEFDKIAKEWTEKYAI